MKIDFEFIVIVLIISGLITSATIGLIALAQTPEEKLFTRCDIDTSVLDSLNLSYDKICKEESIIIHNWERINSVDRLNINASLTSQGFEDRGNIEE